MPAITDFERQYITRLIANASVKPDDSKPCNYSTFVEKVANFELCQERDALFAMIKSTDVNKKFTARCRWRIDLSADLANFDLKKPEDRTNKLYWEIAVLLFKPTSVGELLNILKPDINNQARYYQRVEEFRSAGNILLAPPPSDEFVYTTSSLNSVEIRKKIISQGISFQSNEGLLSLLVHLAPEYYDGIFKNLHCKISIDIFLQNLGNHLVNKPFTQEQKTALAQAITQNFSSLKAFNTATYWLFKTGDVEFLNAGLQCRTPFQNFTEITNSDVLSGLFDDDSTIPKPEILKTMFSDLNPAQRTALITRRVPIVGSLLHRALRHPQVLKVLLESLTADQIKEELTHVEPNGDTLLHHLVRHPESFNTCLPLLKSHILPATITAANAAGETVLHRAALQPNSLIILLGLLPASDKLAALSAQDAYGDCVLHQSADIYKLFLSIPEPDRMAALQVKDKYGISLLNKLITFPKIFSALLSLFKDDEALSLLKTKGNNKTLFDLCNELSADDLTETNALFKSPFIPNLVNIYAVIKEELAQTKVTGNKFFDLKVNATQLLQTIDKAIHCSELKNELVDFFANHPHSPISKRVLAPTYRGTIHQKLDVLKHAWGLNQKDSSPIPQ